MAIIKKRQSKFLIKQQEINMIFRKMSLSFLILSYIFSSLTTCAWAEPVVTGQGAVLVDSRSGKIVFSRNGDQVLPPASLTKILTAVIALEKCKLTDVVNAGKSPTVVEPSIIGIKEGETFTMEVLLYSLLIKSANDAAVAIAEHISGSVPEFMELMNQRARDLGAVNTHFVNPNGLYEQEHYSTAKDIAIIAKRAMELPEFRKIVSTKVKIIPRADDSAVKWLQNHNKMLWRYDGANGVKTGYTKEAKQCLVASAARGQQEFIMVTLGAVGTNVWVDAQNMLDYGFANFDTFKQKEANVPVQTVEVKRSTGNVILVTQKDFYYTTPKGEKSVVSESIEINENIAAPVGKGQILGKMRFMLSGEDIGYVNLVAQNDVEPWSLAVKDTVKLIAVVVFVLILTGVFVMWNVRKRIHREKSKLWINRNVIR
jgi:D-alanyl-D-alanine carboxypeptidase (penicillin-binding protein 5/6)